MGANRSVILGLAVLYEMARNARTPPYPATVELRAVLALLHALSNGDRRPYDAFWKDATEVRREPVSEQIGAVVRKNDLTARWHGILYTFDAEPTIELMDAVHRAGGKDRPPKRPRDCGGL